MMNAIFWMMTSLWFHLQGQRLPVLIDHSSALVVYIVVTFCSKLMIILLHQHS
jgi:hypothetical protein